MAQPEESGYTAPKIIASGIPMSKINDMKLGTVSTIVHLSEAVQQTTSKPHLKLYEATATDKTGSVRVIWFNLQAPLYLDLSKKHVLMGKLEESKGVKTLINPVFSPLDDYKKWERKLRKS